MQFGLGYRICVKIHNTTFYKMSLSTLTSTCIHKLFLNSKVTLHRFGVDNTFIADDDDELYGMLILVAFRLSSIMLYI